MSGRNLRGQNGSVKIETLKNGNRQIDIRLNEQGQSRRVELTQGVAEELLAALSSSLRPYAGFSIFEKVMLELDAVLDRLMAKTPADDGRDPGRAESLTMCLAMIRNPYAPDYPGEKIRQMERWEKRNGESEEVPG